ncbi:MAG: hypothetical protein JO134_04210 [Xanthobacteraceae bacterium]|nr:hypothetical protein [Xanthobacteraceae bacterium]
MRNTPPETPTSEAVGSTPDEFAPAFAAEVERYKKVVARLNLPPQD